MQILIHNDWLRQAKAPGDVFIRKFDKGIYVYQPGDEQTHIHLIEKGIVKIGSYSPDGERVVYDVLQPGEFFGDLNYLGNGIEFFEFAKTITSITVLSIALPFFRHAIVHDPGLSEWFNGNVVRRWWKAETRLLHMTRGDIDARLGNLRNEYDKAIHDSEGRQHNVFDLLSHQVIADLTGSTRQTVSKKLRDALELVSY
ncbi:Crp/Fnr family transcriptional regulator [Spirosoma arcticum]